MWEEVKGPSCEHTVVTAKIFECQLPYSYISFFKKKKKKKKKQENARILL